MSLRRLLNLPCTIVGVAQTGERDEYNLPADVNTTKRTKCYLEQLTTTDQTTGGRIATDDWLLVVGAKVALDSDDRVEVRGHGTFQVFGEPTRIWNPRRRQVSHVEARLRRAG